MISCVAGVAVHTAVSHTLYNVEQIAARNGGAAPLTYKAFEAVVAKIGPPPLPVGDPPAQLPPGMPPRKGFGVPTLAELGYPPQATTVFKVIFATGPNNVTRMSVRCHLGPILEPTAALRLCSRAGRGRRGQGGGAAWPAHEKKLCAHLTR